MRSLALNRWYLCALFFWAAFALFCYGLQNPPELVFDETYYVPAARQLVGGGVNENWSHPPLAKRLIATGMAIFGDNPVGWRIASCVFGAGIVAVVFHWGMVLFDDLGLAGAAGLLTLFNFILFVFARVAMLDVFMVFFMLLGLDLFTIFMRSARLPALFGSAVAMGLSAACKLPGLAPLGFLSILLVRRGKSINLISVFLLLAAAYFFANIVLLAYSHPPEASHFYGLMELVEAQFKMIWLHLTRPPNVHPYSSAWFEWPFGRWPTVFYANAEQAGFVEAIVCMTNPVIAFAGMMALPLALYNGFRNGGRSLLLIGIFLSCWLPWALLQRTSLYYHFFPAASILPLIIVDAVDSLRVSWRGKCLGLIVGGSIAIFVFCRPLLADRPVPAEQVKQRLWFARPDLLKPILQR
jgi:dolichyl-phosphate-mannose--protein O-mannosyl transferase